MIQQERLLLINIAWIIVTIQKKRRFILVALVFLPKLLFAWRRGVWNDQIYPLIAACRIVTASHLLSELLWGKLISNIRKSREKNMDRW